MHRIPIRSEYEDISSLITVNPQSSFNWTAGTIGTSVRAGLSTQEEEENITVSVDQLIMVQMEKNIQEQYYFLRKDGDIR